MINKSEMQAIDLFCGAGGLTHGLELQGVEVILGVDIDPACKFAYESNNSGLFLEKDIEELDLNDLANAYSKQKIRVLAGCAPCQPFSTYSQKGRATRGSKDWKLVLEFGRIVKAIQPELVTMENVPQLIKHGVFKDFLNLLEGYHVSFNIVNCSDYGLGQNRKRLVLLASKLGKIELISPKELGIPKKTVKDCIGNLSKIKAGEVDKFDPLHRSAKLSQKNLKRIQQAKPGKTWRDWEDQSLLAECHKKESGQTFSSVYGRMEWNKPSPTMTTQCCGFGNGRFGHPEQDRGISLREAAILQSFPYDYKFFPDEKMPNFSTVARMIGNAVPVLLGEVVGLSLKKHLEGIETAIA